MKTNLANVQIRLVPLNFLKDKTNLSSKAATKKLNNECVPICFVKDPFETIRIGNYAMLFHTLPCNTFIISYSSLFFLINLLLSPAL